MNRYVRVNHPSTCCKGQPCHHPECPRCNPVENPDERVSVSDTLERLRVLIESNHLDLSYADSLALLEIAEAAQAFRTAYKFGERGDVIRTGKALETALASLDAAGGAEPREHEGTGLYRDR